MTLRPPDFFRLYGPGSAAPPPPPLPPHDTSYSQFGFRFSEPPVFVQPLPEGQLLYDERCLSARPADSATDWPTPKSELRRMAREICAAAAGVANKLQAHSGSAEAADTREGRSRATAAQTLHPAAGPSEQSGAAPTLARVELLCVNMQHLLARLREPEAWAAVVRANEELLADALGAAERLERAAAERLHDDAERQDALSR